MVRAKKIWLRQIGELRTAKEKMAPSALSGGGVLLKFQGIISRLLCRSHISVFCSFWQQVLQGLSARVVRYRGVNCFSGRHSIGAGFRNWEAVGSKHSEGTRESESLDRGWEKLQE